MRRPWLKVGPVWVVLGTRQYKVLPLIVVGRITEDA